MDRNIISKVLCCILGISAFSYVGLRVIDLIGKRDLYISVKGLSDRVVASDTAVCTIHISRDTDQLKSVQEDRRKDIALILGFLKKKGFDESSIEQMSPRIDDNFRYNGKTEGKSKYSVQEFITIKSSDVELVKRTVVELLTYMDDNGSEGGVVTCDTKYRYTSMNELRIDMIKEATLDAQNRAKHIAETVGNKIAGVRNLTTGQFSIVSADASASDNDDWEGRDSVMKRLRVVVSVSFNVES
ncbi:MAG: SIMPL domain-containing protein [Holosporales bacterium]|jgi:hypothetical protein|nr:SIMPL domain-containing protein [Holosporales bacterium]